MFYKRRKLSVNRRLFQKKCWAVAVIFLCICIAIASYGKNIIAFGIIVDEKVEVSAQICGMKGFGIHSVSLTRQQYEQLERCLVDLQARFQRIGSRQEAVSLFMEAVAQINAYGLLPKEISVAQAHQVMCGSFENSKMSRLIGIEGHNGGDKRYYEHFNPKLRNVFCFLSAVATKIPDYDHSPVILPFGLLLLLGLLPAFFASLLGNQPLANTLAERGLYIWNANPIRASNYMIILGYDVALRSVGLLGRVNENLSRGVIFRGYSGLMLYPFDNTTYFFGYAIDVLSSH